MIRFEQRLLSLSGLILCVLGVLCGGPAQLRAQFEMPDPKQMSGIPRPVTDLPDRAVSVRLIRGTLSNNITGHPVELHVGSRVQTAKTDDSGRAQFNGLTPGATLKAVVVVDGERLESQEFPAPAQGGIRLLLVATDSTKRSQPGATTPLSGQVALGGESRIVIEPGEEVVQVYYVLDIVNGASSPVNPATPFVFDMPTGAVGTAVLEGSSSQAKVSGTRVQVQGPFAPGRTTVQIVSELPSGDGTLQLTQRFPAPMERLAVIVKKVGPTTLSSTQIAKQQDVVAESQSFIIAAGGAVAAGQPIALLLGELPHHSAAPRRTALALAAAIVVIGVLVSSRRPDRDGAAEAERRRLVSRRDKLFNDLVRLENEHRNGRGDRARYAARREELIGALERIYGALDGDDTGPEPADRAGLAA
jgi:hypothetical protein